MKNLSIKIKYIFLPFLVIAVGTILFYAGFRWLFDFHWNILDLKLEIWEFWLAFILPLLAILVFLRKRIKLIRANWDNKNQFMYQMFMVIAIVAPNVLLQEYIGKQAFPLIEINSVLDLKNYPNDKYFKIETYSIDKDKSGINWVTSKSGRHNDNLDLKFYAASIFGTIESKIWHGLKYSERYDNQSEELNQAVENLFRNQSKDKFNRYRFQQADYFEKLPNSNDRIAFIQAIKARYPKITEQEQIILVPQRGDFEERNGTNLFWIFTTFGIGVTFVFVALLFPKVDKTVLKKYKNTTRKYIR